MQKVKKYLHLIAQGIFLGIFSALIFILAQSLFSSDGLLQRMYRQFEFTNSVQAAFAFGKRHPTYDGMCSDNVVPEYIQCVAYDDSFKLEMPRPEGGFYCADSSGFNGALNESAGIAPFCQ
tara:strand:- start:2151 stop:2513 length:363 start_codon:yes stop_codon:yes gene_type:complete